MWGASIGRSGPPGFKGLLAGALTTSCRLGAICFISHHVPGGVSQIVSSSAIGSRWSHSALLRFVSMERRDLWGTPMTNDCFAKALVGASCAGG